jgi:cell division protein FtsL
MTPQLHSILIYGLPTLLMIIVWLYFIRRMSSDYKGPKYIKDINENFSRQNEELIGLMREVRDLLKDKQK